MGARRTTILGPVALAALLLLALAGGCDRQDNDWAAFDPEQRELVVEADTLRLDEGGEAAVFHVSLRMVPSDTVTVLIRAQDEQLTIDPDSLVLAPVDDDWAGVRAISVRALDDRRQEGPHTDAVDVLAFSRDLAYDGQGGEALVPILITDDDLAGVAVSETLLTVVESPGTVSQVYELVLESEPLDDVTISIFSTPAEPTLHIEPATLLFTPSNWAEPQRVRLWAEADEVDGDDLELVIGHAAASTDSNYGDALQIAPVDLWIFDSTLPPIGRIELVYEDQDVLYENDAAQAVQVVVSLSRPSDEAVVVHVETRDGTATAGQDYVALAQDLTFLPEGGLSQTLEVQVVDDAILEFEEQFEVAITSVENLFVGDQHNVFLTIEDDDTTELTMSVTDVDEDSGAAMFTVSMPATQMVPLEFTFVTTDVTATAGDDYEAVDDVFVIEQGQTQQTIPVVLYSDPDHEPNETFTARLENLSRHGTWSQPPVTCTILNDDPQAATLAGGVFGEDAGQAVFVVECDAPYNTDVALYVNTIPGDGLGASGGQEDAQSGLDYEAVIGAVRTLPAGAKRLEIPIFLTADTDAEALHEYFRLEIFAADHADFEGLIATATIVDDDQPCLQIEDVRVGEADGTATFRVDLLDGGGAPVASTADVVVAAWTEDQTAEAGLDYEALSTTLTIPAGQTGLDVPVGLLDDAHDDDSESFVLVLGEPQNAAGSCRTEPAFCRIADDEYPSLNLMAVAADEYNEGSDYEFLVQLSTPRQEATTFVMNLSAGSSNGQGVDYDFPDNGPQTIAPGETEMYFTASFLDDQLAGEPDEVLDISVGGANVALGVHQIQATILDAPELSITGDEVNEGETAHFTVSLDEASTADVQFVVQYASDTATAGSDFATTNTGPFTIPAGSLTADVAVAVTANDGGDASIEYFVATIITPTNATLSPFNSAVGTIHDMDPPELQWSGPASADEGEAVEMVVALSWASEVDIRFEVIFTDGEATRSGIDYDDSDTGPFTVPAGQTLYTVYVPTVIDGQPELAAEDFTIELTAPVEAVLGTNVAEYGYVLDIDQPVMTIPAGDSTTEGGDLDFTVHLDRATIVPVFFGLEYDDGSTQGAPDYDSSGVGPFSMMPGTTDTTITVPTFDDAEFENQEAFIVRITPDPTNAVRGDPLEANGTILDDD